MTTETQPGADGTLTKLYQSRIGRARTADEVHGYWAFAVGVVLGLLGILLFLPSQGGGDPLREWSVVLTAAGLALVFAGPIIRLPLRRLATLLVYLGLAICGVAILWFLVAFPADWNPATGQPIIIALYAAGLLVMGVGGVFVPLLSVIDEVERERDALRTEVEHLGETLGQREASERDLTETVAELRRAVEEREASERDLEAVVASLHEDVAYAEADEADLAARIRELREELTAATESEADLEALVERLREDVAYAEADEADLAAHLRTLRATLAEREASEADLRTMVDRLSDDLAVTEASEADLAAQLAALRESQARFEVYEDKGGEFRWRLRHRNGNIIATGGEGYTRRHDAQRGVQSVSRNALGATVLHFDPEETPAEDETFEPVDERESEATFEVYEDKGGEFRYRLRHRNGNIIADCGEGYASRRSLATALERVREYVAPADYLWFDPAGFETYRDRAGKWRWRLVSRNGNIVADSGGDYTRHRSARRAIANLRDRIDDLEFEVYEDNAGEFRWRLTSGNDIIADSGEGYTRRAEAESAVERVRELAPPPTPSRSARPPSRYSRTRPASSAGGSATATGGSSSTPARGTRGAAARETASRA